MDDKQAANTLFSWQSLLIVASIAGLILSPVPLSSSRPARNPRALHTLVGDQDVDARLWQDPFDAVERELQAQKKPKSDHRLAKLQEQIQRSSKDGAPVGLLAVMVNGSPYTEGSESRLRTRHAVLAALGKLRFVPEDEEHVGYVQVPWTEGKDMVFWTNTATVKVAPLPSDTNQQSGLLTIPFERFSLPPHASGSLKAPTNVVETDFSTVFVVWLQEERFLDWPLPRLAQLLQGLDPTNASLQVRLIGPASSTGLEAMGKASYPGTNCPLTEAWPELSSLFTGRLQIFSPWATAADVFLDAAPAVQATSTTGPPSRQIISNSIAKLGARFHNTAVLDDDLDGLLIAELKLRGVDARTDQIAVISEWDTVYGRLAPLTFMAAAKAWKTAGECFTSNSPAPQALINRLAQSVSNSLPPQALTNLLAHSNTNSLNLQALLALESIKEGFVKAAVDVRSDPLTNIHHYAYLKGLDGEASANGSPAPDKGVTIAPGGFEKAEGTSQLDYLRRMAAHLAEKEARDRSKLGTRAIGILGSDVYDKLLVMQALREYFPDALFFTTDLDARLWHPTQYRWTRNLIVASGYNLDLEGNTNETNRAIISLKQSLPPFRENYQTATYRSVCLAVANESYRSRIANFSANDPEVYEIGRSQAVKLHSAKGLLKEKEVWRSDMWQWLEKNTNGLFFQTAVPRWKALLAVGFIPPLLLGYYVLRSRFRTISPNQERSPLFRPLFLVSCLLLGMGGLVCLIGAIGVGNDRLEPLAPRYLLEGISLWTTEACRLLATVLSLGATLYGILTIHSKIRWFESPYGIIPSAAGRHQFTWSHYLGQMTWKHALREVKAAIRSVFAIRDSGDLHQDKVDLLKVWERYRTDCSLLPMFLRIGLLTLVYIGFGLALKALLGDSFVPFRGDRARQADKYFLFGSIGALAILVTFVALAIRDVAAFVRALAPRETHWPDKAKKYALKHRGLPSDLAHAWLDLQLIGGLTARVGKLIYLPFFTGFIMLWSRNPWFDRWPWSTFLLVIYTINALIVIICALVVRHRTEEARSVILEKLYDAFHAPGPAEPKERKELIKDLIKEVQDFKRGAFAPLLEQPLVGALLIPLGSSGSIVLLQRLLG